MINFLEKKQKEILVAIVVLAFFLSLGHSFYFKIEPVIDAKAYDDIAINLVKGNGYVEDPSLPIFEDKSIVRVGPGYEIFLAIVYFLFGHHYEVVWFLQAIFHSLSSLLVFLISKKIFKSIWQPVMGLSAAALIAFSPDLIVISSMLMIATLSIFLMLLSVYFFFKYIEKNDWSSFFFLTVFLAFAILTRSNLLFIVLPYLFFIVLKRQWIRAIFFLLIFVLIFSPWIIRNYNVYGVFMPLNATFGFNLWAGNHLGATGELEPYQPLIDYGDTHSSIETNKYGTKKFFEFLIEEPCEFIKITLKRISIYFSLVRPTGFWLTFSPLQKMVTALFSGIFSVLIFVLGFFGIFSAIKHLKGKKEEFLKIKYLLGIAFLLPAAVIAIIVETRYRFPIYPFLAIFSGFGLYGFFKLKRDWKIFFIVFGFIFANTVFDLLLNKELFIERITKFL